MDIRVENAVDLGSYDFTLTWDSAVLSFVSATNGSFLGSTGRTVTCPPPATGAGTVTFTCSTTGAIAGPNGDGVLATIEFGTVSGGTSPIALSGVSLDDTGGLPLGVTTTDGSITYVEPTATSTTTVTNTPPPATSTPTESATPTPTVAATMTVTNIELWEQARGPWTDLYWRVTVEDGGGSPLAGALVQGVSYRSGAQWAISDTTDSLGQISGTLTGALSNTQYCVRVDGVTLAGYTYAPEDSPFWDGANVVNCYTVVG